ncbi:MAG TPA: hypothetical protein V6C57_18400 [Coleofasciculaceae cyanobacterium]
MQLIYRGNVYTYRPLVRPSVHKAGSQPIAINWRYRTLAAPVRPVALQSASRAIALNWRYQLAVGK